MQHDISFFFFKKKNHGSLPHLNTIFFSCFEHTHCNISLQIRAISMRKKITFPQEVAKIKWTIDEAGDDRYNSDISFPNISHNKIFVALHITYKISLGLLESSTTKYGNRVRMIFKKTTKIVRLLYIQDWQPTLFFISQYISHNWIDT